MSRLKRKQKDVPPVAATTKRRRTYHEESTAVADSNPFDIEGDADGDFWAIKDIIEESKLKYKVDWEDNPRTGEKYAPTWVCCVRSIYDYTVDICLH